MKRSVMFRLRASARAGLRGLGLVAVGALGLSLSACGSTGTGTGTPTPDVAVAADLAVSPPDLVSVPDLTTLPDLATTPDMAGPAQECTQPSDCGGNPCCIQLKNKAYTGITCGTKPSDCAPAVQLTGDGQTRLCKLDADCSSGIANSTLPDCCTAMQGGASIHICFSKALVAFTMGQITCP